MKSRFLLPALAISLLGVVAGHAVPAAAQTVETGRGAFDQLPALKRKNNPIEVGRLIAWTNGILSRGECRLNGQRPEKLDMDIPYAALVEPDGTVKRILIAETGCKPLEAVIGSTIVEMVQRGDVKPTGQDQAYWYGSRIAYATE